jgi:predicted dehydrogenase
MQTSAPSLNTSPKLPQQPRPIVMIGAGGIVNDAHLPAYQKAGFSVAGIYDLDGEKASRTAQRFAIPAVFDSLEEATGRAPAGAVFDIAVPASALPELLPHLPNGAGVLIQKPMGESLAEAHTIRSLCRAKGLKAAINFQLRYAPFVLAARSLVEKGAIGSIHDLEVRVTVYTPWHLWSFLERVSCMEVKYHSIHYLDLVRSFLGDPQGVYARVTNHPKALKMDGTRTSIILDYGDQIRANIATNHFHEFGLRHQESYIKWEGERGAIKAKMGLLMDYPQGVPDQFEYCLLRDGEEAEWQSVEISGSWFPDAFIGTMASLMCYLEGSVKTLPTSVEDAYHTMALVDAVCRASSAGATPICIDP